MELLFLSENHVKQLLNPDELFDALMQGFIALSRGEVSAPARNEIAVPEGFLLSMPAWQKSCNMAVKIVTVFHGNADRMIPGHQAIIALFDPNTGVPLAVMDGGYITAMRTAGGSALSARVLARKNAKILAIVGAGVQGRSHLELVTRVRDFQSIRIASLNPDHAGQLASSHPFAQGIASIEEAVRGADVVCLCTNSPDPVINEKWISPGTHITSVGYFPPRGELPVEIIKKSRLFVETLQAFEPVPVGCSELSGLHPEFGTELGGVLSGSNAGRQSNDEITVYKSMGHAVEDMVTANLVFNCARREGAGIFVKL
jgi:ornithine cyclodeaminase/alanine dehydrogenase-like protein (mu-crystallin family)